MATKTQQRTPVKKAPLKKVQNDDLSPHDRIKLRGLLFAVRDVLYDYDHIVEGEFAWEISALMDASQSVLDELDFQDRLTKK